MRTLPATLAALLVTALPLAACSNDGSAGQGDAGGSSSGSTHAGATIHITIRNGDVTPSGDRVKARVGQPVTLHIEADRSGELHVHSTPEQQVPFGKGTSTQTLTIDKPGIVDVEDHALDKVVVQLEVS